MNIIKLSSENVKRISAVSITPDGNVVNIGGKNGAGKSSVLDSISYALGGEKLVPAEPIRAGQAEAKIIVDIGDFIVTRRFYREKFDCNCKPEQSVDGMVVTETHSDDCHSKLLGETKSTLAVTNREGAKYPSPQKVLDGLLGKLTFDPLAFSREEPKKQNEILRLLTSLDFSMVNKHRKEASDRRLMHKKTLTIAETKLGELPMHTGVPEQVISIEEISAEIKKGQELQRIAQTRIDAVDTVQGLIDGLQKQRAGTAALIKDLRQRLETLDSEQAELDIQIDARLAESEKLAVAMNEARAAVPNFETMDVRLREIDLTNGKIRANVARADQAKEVKRLEGLVATEDDIIDKADKTKEAALQAAKFPVEGLGLTDDGVTFNGLPLEQASSSEQLRISIAIAIALNPTLKVFLIRNANLLDEDSLKLVTEMAAEAKAQVWMEFVTANADGMTVLMEDGHAKLA